MSMTQKSVSIVIPCLNEEHFIVPCLNSAVAQLGFGPQWEILVLDGMSQDRTRALVQQFSQTHPAVRLIDNPGRIQAKAINIALREATGDLIVRMDSHAIFAPDYVMECMKAHEHHQAINVGGPTRTKWDSTFQQAAALAFHHPFTAGAASCHDVQYEGEVENVFMGCWHKQDLIAIGGFDEEFVRNEDDELNLRCSLAGHKIWQSPTIKFWYYPRNCIRHIWQQQYQYGYWKPAVMRKHGRPAKLRHLVPAIFILFLLSGIPMLLFGGTLAWAWTSIFALYSGLLIRSALQAGAQCPWSVTWRIGLIMLTYHLAYGIGSWAGFWHFIVRGKNAAQASERSLKITR